MDSNLKIIHEKMDSPTPTNMKIDPRKTRIGWIGTGVMGGVAWLVTGDERWQKRLAPIASRVRVCYMGEFV